MMLYCLGSTHAFSTFWLFFSSVVIARLVGICRHAFEDSHVVMCVEPYPLDSINHDKSLKVQAKLQNMNRYSTNSAYFHYFPQFWVVKHPTTTKNVLYAIQICRAVLRTTVQCGDFVKLLL